MSNTRSQIKYGAIISYAAVAFSIVAGLLYTPWMIGKIGNSNYAIYTLATSVVNLFLVDFGLSSAVSRFLSNYYAKKQYDDANRFLGMVYKIYIVIAALIFCVLFVFYFNIGSIYTKFSPDEINVLKALFVAIGLYSVVSFPFISLNGILMANEKFIQLKICNLVQKILTVVLIVIALLLSMDVFALVMVNVVVGIAVIAVKLYIIGKIKNVRVDFSYSNSSLLKDIFLFSGWVTLSQLALRCIFNIMPTLIGIYCAAASITLFGLASMLESYLYTVADAINGLFMPKIARVMNGENTSDNLLELMIRVGRFQLIIVGMIFVIFCCIGKDFVILWLGPEMSSIYICAVLMMFSSIVELPQQIAKNAIVLSEYVRYQSYIYIAMAVINVGLALVLIRFFDVLGAAISIFLAYNLRTVLLNILYVKKLHINILKYFQKVYSSWLAVTAITVAAAVLVNIFISNITIIGFIVKGAVLSVAYAAGIYVIMLNRGEKQVIFKFLNRRAR